MDIGNLIYKTADLVRSTLSYEEGGHDWWHIYRVWNTARHIAQKEGADLLIAELGALLHDIADSKFYNGDETIGPRRAQELLASLNAPGDIVEKVRLIVANVSFKGVNHTSSYQSPELDVVQDADRLDAMGAIGIARAFNYGGYTHRPIYDPDIKPVQNMTKDQYKQSESPTINHFYEKILLLKDKMNTETGSAMALERHKFLEVYLEQFYKEWGMNNYEPS